MKTIEERASAEFSPHGKLYPVAVRLLTELAADLNAEKEKELEKAASNWQESALHFSNGLEFYRGIVRQIGEMFGEAAKTSDDGSVQKDALALKVPELVDELIARAAEHEKEVAELKKKLATLAKDYSEAVAGESEMEELTGLRETNRRIANESIANQLALQSVCYKQRAALEYYAGAPWVGHAGSWSNSNIAEPANVALENKFDSSLLDEVKSALEYANQLAKQISGDGRGHARFEQLLTRLGSNE